MNRLVVDCSTAGRPFQVLACHFAREIEKRIDDDAANPHPVAMAAE